MVDGERIFWVGLVALGVIVWWLLPDEKPKRKKTK